MLTVVLNKDRLVYGQSNVGGFGPLALDGFAVGVALTTFTKSCRFFGPRICYTGLNLARNSTLPFLYG
jgi:hypothetical protein